ncbi:uncharacterized protein LOC117330540 [Pecten maximus]|uniref:uncharacterized protein LOC117330540 n=1 Tax=Pecten maximus TaxID=6579 RepID=UPI0014590EAE|nr:uncharacterized protein LOC117330540 [Pecten maximus]
MLTVMLHHLILTAAVSLKTFSFVDGHGQCARNEHVDMESNRNYTSFKLLDTIGLLQCIKICKQYKLCEKIHHNRDQLTCNLMMRSTERGNETSLLNVQSIKMNSSGCSAESCSETEACIDRMDGSFVCIDIGVCPTSDWVGFNQKCYFFTGSEMTADENVAFCKARNTSLVNIDNKEMTAFLRTEMTKRGIPAVWLAKDGSAAEKKWVWKPGDEVLDNAQSNSDEMDLLNNESTYWGDSDGCAKEKLHAACEVGYATLP